MIYIFFTYVFIIFSYIDVCGLKDKRFIPSILGISLIFLVGFRYNAGTDYLVYYALFENLEGLHDINFEVGLTTLVHLLKEIGFDVFDIFFIIGLLSLIPVIIVCCKYSRYPILSIFIYFSLYLIPINFNAIGQGLATGLFFISLLFFNKKRNAIIFIIAVIASLVHSSGFFIFIVYIFYRITIRKDFLFFIIFTSFILFVLNNYIYNLVMLLPFDFLVVKMKSYSDLYSDPVKYTSILQRCILVFSFMFFYDKFDEFNKRLISIYVVGFLIYSIFSFNGLIATRINLFYKVLDVLLVSNLLYLIKGKGKLFACTLLLVFGFIILSGNFKNEDIWNYKTIFNY